MPIIFTDQFWVMDPYSPPPPGTVLTVQNFTVRDNNSNNLLSRRGGDSINGSDIRAVYPGDTVKVVYLDGSIHTITGVTFYLADGTQVFTPTDGSVLQTAALISTTWTAAQNDVPNSDLDVVPCFAPGTLIETTVGPVPVEDLCYGNLISTSDRGPTPLVLVHKRSFSEAHLKEHPKHCPIAFEPGSLGDGMPARRLVVSPQHRMLICSAIAERMFGSAEIMVPACKLVGMPGITRLGPEGGVDYVHVLVDHHAVICAEGAPTETLYLGEQVHESLNARDIELLRARLSKAWKNCMTPARPFQRGKRLRNLLERLKRNNKALVDGYEFDQTARQDRERLAG